MTSRSRVIALFLPTNLDGPVEVGEGVQRYVERHAELSLISFCSNDDSFLFPTVPPVSEPPWKGRADGVIAFLRRFPEIIAWAQSGGVPIVNTISETFGTPIVSVFGCPATRARLAIDHLADLGYRSFAFIGWSPAFKSRLDRDALDQELTRRKLRLQTAILSEAPVQCDNWNEFGRPEQIDPAVLKLVKRARKPLAVLTSGSDFAVALCRTVGWLGLRIPEDVAVLCLNDSSLAKMATPSLTAIRTAGEQVGYEAARVLHRMMEGKRVSKTNIPVAALELIVRESTARQQSAARDAVSRALEMIRRDGCGKLRVEDVAARACISLRSLEINFNATIGHSLGDEIRLVRLARIKELLSETDLSLNQIAKRTGFSGGAYLNKFFHQWAKQDALDYRRRQRKKAGAVAAASSRRGREQDGRVTTEIVAAASSRRTREQDAPATTGRKKVGK